MNLWTGELELNMRLKEDKTIADKSFARGGFRLMRPFYLNNDAQANYTVLNPGGGYLDGDRYRMVIHMQEKASLLLTTQSATKIYKTPKKGVSQTNLFLLEEGSTLYYVADPIIAYEQSIFYQRNKIYIKNNSTMILTDIVTPGWSERGEKFTYKDLKLRTEIYDNKRLIALDILRLIPNEMDLSSMGYLEGYSHCGTMLIFTDDIKEFINKVSENLNCAEENKLLFSYSCIEDKGLIVRVFANTTPSIQTLFLKLINILNEIQGKEPCRLRKY